MATEKSRSSIKKLGKSESQRISPTTSFLSPRMVELLTALEKRGLLEAATGVLNDEETFSKIMALFSSDETLNIIQNAKTIINLLSTLNYNALIRLSRKLTDSKQAFNGLSSLIQVVDALESRGLLEPIAGFLNDEKTFSSLAKFVSSDSSLTVVNNLEKLIATASSVDPEVLETLIKVVGSMKTQVKPVKGLLAITRELGDPAVAAGMGRLFEMLRVLGEDASRKSA